MLDFKTVVPTCINEKNELRIKNLAEDIAAINPLSNKKQLVFILGAGVSLDANITNWYDLLAKCIEKQLNIFENYFESDSYTIKKWVNENLSKSTNEKEIICKRAVKNANLLEIAEYILNFLKSDIVKGDINLRNGITSKRLADFIGDCIYLGEDNLKSFKKNSYKNSSLAAVAKVIKKQFDNSGCAQKVLTYNYDNLLESCLISEEKVKESTINSISYYSENLDFKKGNINIAHIHGKIDVEHRDYSPRGIILSESSYYNMESNDYLWQHTVQAQAMLHDICLFVGFSADDHNFRRIVRHSNNVKNAFIIFTIDDIIKDVFGNKENTEIEKAINENTVTYEQLLITYFVTAKTKYWENYGIKPIWTNISNIPKVIKRIGGI